MIVMQVQDPVDRRVHVEQAPVTLHGPVTNHHVSFPVGVKLVIEEPRQFVHPPEGPTALLVVQDPPADAFLTGTVQEVALLHVDLPVGTEILFEGNFTVPVEVLF